MTDEGRNVSFSDASSLIPRFYPSSFSSSSLILYSFVPFYVAWPDDYA